MTAAEVVRTRLLALSAVTAIVGQRVRTLILAQNETLPAIRVQRISESEPMHLRGSSGLQRARVQVDSYASTFAAARSLDAAVHGDGAGSGLCAFTGVVGSANVRSIVPMNVQDLYEKDEREFYRVSRDYEVQFSVS